MGVGLVAAPGRTVVGLVRGVHVHMLLTIAGVGEATITALDLALERLLACNTRKHKLKICYFLFPVASWVICQGRYNVFEMRFKAA